MSSSVYVIEKNDRELHILHQRMCFYASERIINLGAFYTSLAAFNKFQKAYPNVTPCRHCCSGLDGYVMVGPPIKFAIEDWLYKRKRD